MLKSASRTLDNWVETLRQSPWQWLMAILTAMLAFHGFSESDAPDFVHIARNTTQIMAPVNRQYLYSSPLNYMIGDFLGMPGLFGFYFIHIVEIIGMCAVIVVCVRKKFASTEEQIRFLTFLSFTPLWLIILKWIGKPDPILVSMLFLCWAFPGRWRWLFAAIMIMAHREMGSFMCLFFFLSEEKQDWNLIVPVTIGYGFHWLYEHVMLDRVPSSRVADITIDIWKHPKEVMERPVLFVLGSLTWYWLVVIWQRPTARLSILLIAAFLIAGISEDFTRDFIMLALPPILFHLERIVKTPSSKVLEKFLPLALLQIQIAAMGVVFKPNNIWIDWVMGDIGDQLVR